MRSPDVLACAQAGNTAEYQPHGSIREYFLGGWKLVSTEVRYPDGHTTPYPETGPDGIGFLMYIPSGHMCAQLMKPGRPNWHDEWHSTAGEAASALDGFVSYCGTFEIRESERTIIHRIETCSMPNWLGTEQRRPYQFVSQDRFFFRGTREQQRPDGRKTLEIWTITWERLK